MKLAQFLLVAIISLVSLARGDIVHVAKGDDLQEAVLSASDGDVLMIDPGLYDRIVIHQSDLTLMATGPGVWIHSTSSDPTIQISGPGYGEIVLFGLEVRNFESPGYCVLIDGKGLDRLSLLGCDVGAYPGGLSGVYDGKPAIESNSASIYVAESTVVGGPTTSDGYHYGVGLPAIIAPEIIARDATLIGGYSGDYVVTDDPMSFCSAAVEFDCNSFTGGVSGTAGPAAVSTPRFIEQGSDVAGGKGVAYYCCPGGCMSGYDSCTGGGFHFLGYGPQGPPVDGEQHRMPESLDGTAVAPLGSNYVLNSDLGSSGGVLVAGIGLGDLTELPGLGLLGIDVLGGPFLTRVLPQGASSTSFTLSTNTNLIGQVLAFQAWDPQSGLGVPLLVLITP